MKVGVEWRGEKRMEGRSEDGRSVMLDGDREVALSPMEAMLAAAGSCSAEDVVTILEKRDADLKSLEVEIDAERAEDHPRRFTKVRLRYHFEGEGLSERWMERAIELSVEKYCSVLASLREGEVEVEVGHSLRG